MNEPKENKTLTVKVTFWTDGIASKKGDVMPKHTWDYGVVRMDLGDNSRHGITQGVNPVPFHGMYDLERAMRKLLRAHKIVQHIG